MSHRSYEEDRPTEAMPAEPADVDALLAESLKAQTEQDFTWKEPERRLRWWERAEAQEPSGGAVSSATSSQVSARSRSSDSRTGVRMGSVVFSLVALVLAAWVIASVVFSVSVEPLMVGLVVCTLAGLAMIGAGLRPKPGRRI